MNCHIILGPPGTGKTTRLLDIMEKEIQGGTAPNRIAFCSFTKKATDESTTRACDRFSFSRSDLPYFRTIHSLSFQSLGLNKANVMQNRDYTQIGDHLGIRFSSMYDYEEDGLPQSMKNKGDQYNFIHAYSRTKKVPLVDVWENVNHDSLNWFELLRYVDTLNEYKKMKGLYDFTDMLAMNYNTIGVDVVIIDEAQDLSACQWDFIASAFKDVKRMYIGGDDDQAIFEWSGASVDRFLSLNGKREILHQSYRVPQKVHDIATDISSKIVNRTQKQYASTHEAGSVEHWDSATHIDMSSGTWLLLARNTYLLSELIAKVREKGYTYCLKGKTTLVDKDVRAIKAWERGRQGQEFTPQEIDLLSNYTSDINSSKIWHEAFDRVPVEKREYYISLLRNGVSLTAPPRINISTIHGSKGGEADNVVLLTDMAYSTWDAIHRNPDSEHRVWYVGATRARHNLHIVMPRGRYYYQV